jgi:Ca2+-binding RTX toxin-like protein
MPGGFGDQDVVMTLADRNDAARAFKVSFGHIAVDGGAGNDTISGGFGRDFIDGHDEADTIDCGAGLDRYVPYAGDTVSNCEVPQA